MERQIENEFFFYFLFSLSLSLTVEGDSFGCITNGNIRLLAVVKESITFQNFRYVLIVGHIETDGKQRKEKK